MSADADKNTVCPNVSVNDTNVNSSQLQVTEDKCEKKCKKTDRKVAFPDDEQLVTQYFEPANPWQDVPSTTRAQLAAEYLEWCRRHATPPIDSVLQQIRELPETAIGGGARAPRLSLSECSLLGAAPADALEAVLRRAQFRRLEIDHAALDDEGAEAIFDMLEYYESATVVCISGPRQFGIRGWQAASRMIKKSAELTELEVSESPLEAAHAPVLARALRPHTCRLRTLCLQRASLAGEPLLCLVIALKSNSSIRELRLGDNCLTPTDASQLASLLRLNTRLQLLDLSNNQIQDAGVGHIADALVEQAAQTPPSAATSPMSPHQCPLMGGYEARGLAFLVLWNNQLTRNCANHLSKALRASQSLCVLNIGRNALGTEAVRALQAGGALVSLGLQAARLGPDAARAVADLIRADTGLQRLDLRDNRLGGAGLQAILVAMRENTTLTQIDLDEPTESALTLTAEDSEAATVARLTREIRALCRRNEPAASSPERRVHRKISLTCHTACLARGMQGVEEDRRGNVGGSGGRLRSPAPSPAPSPAGSPVPAAHPHSRFSVTRVTPERESSTESSSPSTPTRPTYSTPSRFRVVQVVEPPQIQVHSATKDQPRKTTSRFSVTRNYDSVYNPIVPSPPPTPVPCSMKTKEKSVVRKADSKASENPAPSKSITPVMVSESKYDATKPKIGPSLTEKIKSDVSDIKTSDCDVKGDVKSEKDAIATNDNVKNGTTSVKNAETIVKNDAGCVKSNKNTEKTPVIVSDNVKSMSDNIKNTVTDSSKTDKTYSHVVDNKNVKSLNYQDRFEHLTHDESVSQLGDDKMFETETKLVKTLTEMSDMEKVDVQVEITVKKENVHNVTDTTKVSSDQTVCRNEEDYKNIDDITVITEKRDNVAMKQIEAITEDLGHLIQEIKDLSTKTAVLTRKEVKVKSDCTQTEALDVNSAKLGNIYDVPVNFTRDNVVLKKNKSESSLDSPDLEVSRLMNKKLVGSPFCDSSSSLEISGSSVESLNTLDNQQNSQTRPIIIQESVESDGELDRRKGDHVILSTESSIESNTSEITPVNSGNLLNTSVSSNESVSPIIFSITKKIHGSLSSLEASVSSLDSAKQEKVMVTSADSGIEYSLQNPLECKEDNSSNEGTLTNYSSLKETVKKPETFQLQDTLTSPKRTSSLLDVPALKNRGLDRMRKISWVAPSASFHIPKPEPEKIESKLPSHLEKLLSLFQHPSSLFSRSASHEEEKKSASYTPPRKDSSLTTSFWSWGSTIEKADKEDREDSSSEATDSTLSERVQISFVDESFSKKLDSKTPSTDTDNTLSEFQSFPIQGNSETSDASQTEIEKRDRVTDITTDDNVVQKSLVLSLKSMDNASSNGNKDLLGACDTIDLIKPNDLNKNVYDTQAGESNKNPDKNSVTENKEKSDTKQLDVKLDDVKTEPVRPRSFAAVLKSSGSENSLDKQSSPETGHPIDKLPSKIIRGIKENISPENTLTSSMTNTKTLAYELNERQVKNQAIVNTVWELTTPLLDKSEPKTDQVKVQSDLAPIATIDETCDESIENALAKLDFIDDVKSDKKDVTSDSGLTVDGKADALKKYDIKPSILTDINELENVDLGKDALSYLIEENTDMESQISKATTSNKAQQSSLAQELKEAEIKEQLLDVSPELIIDEAVEVPEVFTIKELTGLKTSPVIPERAKIKKSNSLEDISQRPADIAKEPKTKTIAFKVPEMPTKPRDIPERRTKLRTRSGSSPKSLPESLNKPCPLTKMDSIMSKKKKKVSSLGKIARDSLLALNMNEEEIAEFRKSYKLTSVESLRSLESVSEDANSQSGNSVDSRCRACLRTSQESLMSLDSITEDCRCVEDCDRAPSHSAR